MTRKLGVLLALLALLVGTAAAQDARSVLQAAATASGANNVKSIQYSGTGTHGAVGQSFQADVDWPRTNVKSFTRTIDYDSKSLKEEMVRVQGNNPARGGGFIPLVGEVRSVSLVSDKYAWNVQGNNAVPQPAAVEGRQLEIWITPHGFLQAALTGNPTASERYLLGRRLTVIGFTAMGKYRVTGEFNDQNLLERVLTWIPDPVMGDMQYEIRYSDYKDFGGVKFPMHIHAHQGDHPLLPGSTGRNSLDIRVSSVQPNVSGAALTVPDNVRQASVPPVRVDSQKLADGVWLVAGGSHNSLAVEFRDFIAVIEAPLNEERSTAVIAEVKKLIPNKQIKYLVNTHHHFDHLGGIRSYVAEGAAVVTHESNREFYKRAVFSPQVRTLQPDRLSLFPFATTSPIVTQLETFTDQYSITDAARTLEVHHLQGLNHNAGMLIAYLPKEKIVVEADLYSPPVGDAPPAPPNASAMTFYDNLKRLKLDVAQIAPIHGRVGTVDEFEKIVGPAAANRQRGSGE